VRFVLSRSSRVAMVVSSPRGRRSVSLTGRAGMNSLRLPRLRGARWVAVTTRGDDGRGLTTMTKIRRG